MHICLHPGELGTAAGLFDVIAFSNQAWAWSATYAQRLSLLSSTQVGVGAFLCVNVCTSVCVHGHADVCTV